MAPANFRLKVVAIKENISRVEGFVEDVCDYNNVFNLYFGNILVATCEFFSFLAFKFPDKEIELYSRKKKGALVVGFNLQEKFFEIIPFLQKNLSEYIESENITENERSLLSTTLLSDDVFLDFTEQNVELLFNIKREANDRGVKISKYFERVSDSSIVKTKKEG